MRSTKALRRVERRHHTGRRYRADSGNRAQPADLIVLAGQLRQLSIGQRDPRIQTVQYLQQRLDLLGDQSRDLDLG